MSLKKCRECSVMVSESAKVCPSCGIKKPGKGGNERKWGVALLALLVIGSVVNIGRGQKGFVYEPEDTSRPECQVTMRNGVLSKRACDLVELCKDRAFYAKKAQQAKTLDDQISATSSLRDVAMWLTDYDPDDVEAVCSGTYGKEKPALNTATAPTDSEAPAQVAKKVMVTFSCSTEPAQLFPTGKIFGAKEFLAVMDQNCIGAHLDKDGEASLSWSGREFILATQVFSPGTDAEKFMINSVRPD